MSHTPGPWMAERDPRNTYAWKVTGADGVVPEIARIALVDQGPAVVEANARLIAAAPDLLEAAQSASIDLGFYRVELHASVLRGDLTWEEAFHRLRLEMKVSDEKLDAAISRATGN